MKNKVLKVYGRDVSLMFEGSGKPFFFLHGWGGAKESWQPLWTELRKTTFFDDHLAVAIDFPGFGASEEPDSAWGVTDYSHFFEEFLKGIYREMDLDGDYDLAVHSFGGRVLLKLLSPNFAHLIVQRPDNLILIAAAGIKPKKTLRLHVATTAAKTGKAVLSLPVLNRLAPLAQKVLYKALKTHDYEKSSGVMRETFLRVIDEDLSGSMSHIKNHTKIFWGKKDGYVPLSDGEIMHEKIITSEMTIIPEGKHGIHKTHAELLAREIVTFLST